MINRAASAAGHLGQAAAKIGYHGLLAHRLFIVADLVLPPTSFEPFSLLLVYAVRYGVLPIVGPAGGTVDRRVPANFIKVGGTNVTGFAFSEPCVDIMLGRISKALKTFSCDLTWRIRTQAARRNFNWKNPAKRYMKIYDDPRVGFRDVTASTTNAVWAT